MAVLWWKGHIIFRSHAYRKTEATLNCEEQTWSDKTLKLTKLAGTRVLPLAVLPFSAQEMTMQQTSTKNPVSATAKATVTLKGKAITIDYCAPSARGRKIFGGLVPYDKVWRTGANAATTLKTPIHLKIGTIDVPAGTYTIYSLPSQSGAKLIVNKQTGQWGTEYDQSKDLGRTELTSSALSAPVETFAIEFSKPAGDTTTLHLKWEKTDLSVSVSAA